MGAPDLTRGRAFLCLLLALVALPSPAHAQDDGPRLRWSEDWARVHPASYVAFPTALGGVLFFDALYTPRDDALVLGALSVDAAARRAFIGEQAQREQAAEVSDVLLAILYLWPIVDSGLVVGVGDQNPDVFGQLTLIALEAAIADYVFGTLIKVLVHRERPHGALCSREDRDGDPVRCGTRGRTRSFYSGHASAAFRSAGVVCVTHAHLPIYGNPVADAAACGVSLALASAVGILRIVADRHHFSDVFAGAIAGLLTGALMPYLLHFREGVAGPRPDRAVATSPLVLRVGGRF